MEPECSYRAHKFQAPETDTELHTDSLYYHPHLGSVPCAQSPLPASGLKLT